MIRSTNRQGSSDSMRMAILADEITRSLREVSLHKRVWDRDRRVISQAVEILTQMMQAGRGMATKGRQSRLARPCLTRMPCEPSKPCASIAAPLNRCRSCLKCWCQS